jgi:hypothetical protein
VADLSNERQQRKEKRGHPSFPHHCLLAATLKRVTPFLSTQRKTFHSSSLIHISFNVKMPSLSTKTFMPLISCVWGTRSMISKMSSPNGLMSLRKGSIVIFWMPGGIVREELSVAEDDSGLNMAFRMYDGRYGFLMRAGGGTVRWMSA